MKSLKTPKFNVEHIRNEFPIFKIMNRLKPLIYFDSAATSQKPRCVINAISNFYENDYSNIHRGIYELSERASELYESARETVRDFINAAHRQEIIFVSGTTEGINFLSQTFLKDKWQQDDEIIISAVEHHSNIVPWHFIKKQYGIKLKVIPVKDDGSLDLEAYQKLFSNKTKLVSVAHVSNVLGIISPLEELIKIAHEHQVPIVVDGAQGIPHLKVDVRQLDCDFYIFSAHKIYGPTGIGVVYGKKEILETFPPYQGGGGMIETVSFEDVTYAPSPYRFEAGTPPINGALGLKAALEFVNRIGYEDMRKHEEEVLDYTEARLREIPNLQIIGEAHPKIGVISFVIKGIHSHDVGTILDHSGIAVRAGHHCAMPLMERFNVSSTVRVSLGVYNTLAEVDALSEALQKAIEVFSC